MKTIITIFVAVLLLTVNGYSQNTKVKTLLNKPETRTEVFNTILGDHQLMMEFMTAMKGNEHAMMMMNQNNQMMKQADNKEGKNENQMMGHDHIMGMNKKDMMNSNNMDQNRNQMMKMMKDNPEMMQNIMEDMMKMCDQDSTLRSKMSGIISEHPKMMGQMHTINNRNQMHHQNK